MLDFLGLLILFMSANGACTTQVVKVNNNGHGHSLMEGIIFQLVLSFLKFCSHIFTSVNSNLAQVFFFSPNQKPDVPVYNQSLSLAHCYCL